MEHVCVCVCVSATCMQMFTAHTENESLWEGLVKMGQVMHSLLQFCDIPAVLKRLGRVSVDCWAGLSCMADGFTGVNISCWDSPEQEGIQLVISCAGLCHPCDSGAPSLRSDCSVPA